MKKIEYIAGNQAVPIGELIARKQRELIDLINSHSEAIERLEKMKHEVGGMGQTLVNHYNDPSAHKQELEAPVDDCDTESTDWPTIDVQNILYKHFYIDKSSHQKVIMADYEIRSLIEKQEAVYQKPEMVSKARYAEKLGIHDNPHEHVYRCQDCDKTQAEVEDTDTHRTVTLRIPKDMTVAEAMWKTRTSPGLQYFDTFWELSDTDLQAEIDKIGERDERD